MKILRLCLSFVCLIALCACASKQAALHYIPINKPGGRMCAMQCTESSERCHQLCVINERACVTKMQTQAIQDYDAYVKGKWLSHEKLEFRPSDFDQPEKCPTTDCDEVCEQKHQTCYTGCGGKVEKITDCSFLCF